MMAALGAAFLVSSCSGGGGNTPPPVDCTVPASPIATGCAELRLSSTPVGAAVTVDGVALGLTPAVWLGETGTVTVEATLDGYEPYLEDVLLGSGRAVDHNAVLVPTASVMGTLMVSADVLGGTVVVDGVDHGIMDTMPMGIDLPEGTHRIEVQGVPGHVSSWDQVMIVREETSAVTISVGRDISGRWTCTAGLRMVMMDATMRNTVLAPGLDSFTSIHVNGDRLSSMAGGTITGTISADGQSLEYTFTGPGGSVTERCTR